VIVNAKKAVGAKIGPSSSYKCKAIAGVKRMSSGEKLEARIKTLVRRAKREEKRGKGKDPFHDTRSIFQTGRVRARKI
jgi:hypothetical protein